MSRQTKQAIQRYHHSAVYATALFCPSATSQFYLKRRNLDRIMQITPISSLATLVFLMPLMTSCVAVGNSPLCLSQAFSGAILRTVVQQLAKLEQTERRAVCDSSALLVLLGGYFFVEQAVSVKAINVAQLVCI